MAPKVSVIMPLYNGAAHVSAGIESVLRQDFGDLELLVIDDGSTDDSAATVASIADPRVRLIRQANSGAAQARNRGLAEAAGQYIAFQDHDDLSLPRRLAAQLAYFEAHPDCGLLGSRSTIVRNDVYRSGHDHPLEDARLRFDMMFDNYFVTSSVMAPRRVFDEVGGFARDPRRHPEDYELWSRIARRYPIANLADRLVVYREFGPSLSQSYLATRKADLAAENMAAVFGLEAPTLAMRDLAFWHHEAYDALSPKPDFAAMFAVVRQAAVLLEAMSGGAVALRPTAEARIGDLIMSRAPGYLPFGLRLRRRLLRQARKLRHWRAKYLGDRSMIPSG